MIAHRSRHSIFIYYSPQNCLQNNFIDSNANTKCISLAIVFLYLNASLDLNRHRLIAQKMDWASCLSRAHCLTIDVNKNGSRHAIFPDSKFFIFVGLRSACANPPNALKSPAFGGRLRSTLNLDETNFRYNNFDYFHWRRIVLFLSIPHSPITIPIPLDANLISDRKIAKR